MKKQQLVVKGMHCASCSVIISQTLKKLPGVVACDVNIASDTATVEYDPEKSNLDTWNDAVTKLGYTLEAPADAAAMHMSESDHAAHMGLSSSKEAKLQELDELRAKVHFSLPITLIVFVFMMWDIFAQLWISVPNLPFPMPLFNVLLFGLSTIILFVVGAPFVDGVLKFVRYRVANMDSLIGIGTLTAYVYSSIILLFPPLRTLLGLPEYVYFDVVIVVIGFVVLGKYLEGTSKLKTGEAIEKLMHLQAKTATILRDGVEVEVPLEEVVIGDKIVVKPGSKIPVDGSITMGKTAINESMITGEPMPQDKTVGDMVIGGTMNTWGAVTITATRVGADTLLAQIVKLVAEAQGSKAPIQKMADRIAAVFVPTVLITASITLILWLSVGTMMLGFTTALSYGLLSFVSILVIACPCALGLATPTAIIVGVGKGAEKGILIKNAESLQKLSSVNAIIFDKTGTITTGNPTVTDVEALDSAYTVQDVAMYAASLEKSSSHPLARAIVQYAALHDLTMQEATDFSEQEGIGVSGKIDHKSVTVRKPLGAEYDREMIKNRALEGKTLVMIEVDTRIIGMLAISDTVKESAMQSIKRLHDFGIKTIMLTGDHAHAAHFIAAQVGIDDVRSDVLPQDKAAVIKKLQSEGMIVAMAGDGVNDAPALAQADVAIAMATGTDVAIASSDITLLRGDIAKIPQAFALAKHTMRTIRQNLFWAFAYNVIGIPLAAGALYPIWGIFMNPVFAGMAMGLSSFSVVSNSLLLKRIKID